MIPETEKMALAMLAGARAIEQNKKYFGATLVHDVFSEHPKEITYYDAANLLREQGEELLERLG